MRWILVTACMLALITGASAETFEEDKRWLVGNMNTGEGEQEVAAFLDGMYAWVVLRASCDRETHELVIDYVADERNIPPEDTISIGYSRGSGERWIALATTFDQGWMTGRIAVGPEVLTLLGESEELAVWTPDSGDYPWAIGRGAPLRKIVESCRPAP